MEVVVPITTIFPYPTPSSNPSSLISRVDPHHQNLEPDDSFDTTKMICQGVEGDGKNREGMTISRYVHAVCSLFEDKETVHISTNR